MGNYCDCFGKIKFIPIHDLPQQNFKHLIDSLRLKYPSFTNRMHIVASVNTFMDLKKQIRNIYMGIISHKIAQTNQYRISIKQCKVQIAELFLQIQIQVFKFIEEKVNFQQAKVFYSHMQQFLKKVCSLSKTKYLRNSKTEAGDLSKKFKQFDWSQKYQYDMLQNAGIYFSSEEPLEITKTIKQFFNIVIGQLQRGLPRFQNIIQDIGINVKCRTKVSRKISDSTTKYIKLQTGTIEVKSTQISRVLIKWMEDIEEILLKPQSRVNFKSELKISRVNHDNIQSEKNVFYRCDQKVYEKFLQKGLIQQIHQTKEQFQENELKRKSHFEQFNIGFIKLLNQTKFNEANISKQEGQVVMYSYLNTNFISWMVEQKIIQVISKLVQISKNYKTLEGNLDLIKFKVSDLLRSQIIGDRKQIEAAYDRLIEKQGQDIQIIKIKNRFKTVFSDSMILFKMKGSFLICECQLIITEEEKSQDKKAKNIQTLNHFLYELQRSPFGVTGQLAVFLMAESQTISQYQNKVPLSVKNNKRIDYCLLSHKEKAYNANNTQKKPFICSKCLKFYSKNKNPLKIHQCSKCMVTICNICQGKTHKQVGLKNEFYLALQNQITRTKKDANLSKISEGKSQMLKRTAGSSHALIQKKQQKDQLISKLTMESQLAEYFQQIQIQRKIPQNKSIVHQSMIQKKSKTFEQTHSIMKKNQQKYLRSEIIDGKYKQSKKTASICLKQDKIKVQSLINYFLQEQIALKNNWKIHFIILSKVQEQTKIRLYRYDALENIIINVYQPLERYEKHEEIQINYFDIILELKEIYRKRFKAQVENFIQKTMFIFENQSREQVHQKIKNGDYLIYFQQIGEQKLIIDLIKKGNHNDDWLSNYLSDLPPLHNLRSNIQLSSLQISNEDLFSFYKIDWIQNIKKLDLSRNHIKQISELIKRCPLLQKLDLCSNEIETLSFKHKQLKYLILDSNKISKISNLHELTSLVELHLSKNSLTQLKVPEKQKSLTYLQNLIVSKNTLNDLKIDISKLHSLKQLDISFCGLTDQILKNTFYNVPDNNPLQQLILNNNRLSELPNLSFFRKLKQINLDMNPLSNFQFLQNKPSQSIYSKLKRIQLTYDKEGIRNKIRKNNNERTINSIFCLFAQIFSIQQNFYPRDYSWIAQTQKIQSLTLRNRESRQGLNINLIQGIVNFQNSGLQKKPSKQESKRVRNHKRHFNKKQQQQNRYYWAFFYVYHVLKNFPNQNKNTFLQQIDLRYKRCIQISQSILTQENQNLGDEEIRISPLSSYKLDLSHIYEFFEIEVFVRYNWHHLIEINLSGTQFDDAKWIIFVNNEQAYPKLKRLLMYHGRITKIQRQDIQAFKNIQYVEFERIDISKQTLFSTRTKINLAMYNKQNQKAHRYVIFDQNSREAYERHKKSLKDKPKKKIPLQKSNNIALQESKDNLKTQN